MSTFAGWPTEIRFPNFDRAYEALDVTDLWEHEREQARKMRPELPSDAARRLNEYLSAPLALREVGGLLWRGLSAPAFDHAEVAEHVVASMNRKKSGPWRDVTVRIAASRMWDDPLVANEFSRMVNCPEERHLAYGANLLFAEQYSFSAANLTQYVADRDTLVTTVQENMRWVHKSPRNVGALLVMRRERSSKGMTERLGQFLREVLERQARFGHPVAAVLFANDALALEERPRLMQAWELLHSLDPDASYHSPIVADKVAAALDVPEIRSAARQRLLQVADRSAFVTSWLVRHRRYPEVGNVLPELLLRFKEDPYCLSSLAKFVANDPSHPKFEMVREACEQMALNDRYASVHAAEFAQTDSQRGRAFDALTRWERPSAHQVASALRLAGDDDDRHERIGAHVRAGIGRNDQIVSSAAAAHVPDRYEPDGVVSALLAGTCNNDVDSARNLGTLLSRLDNRERFVEQVVQRVADGKLPSPRLGNVVRSSPELGREIAVRLMDFVADDADVASFVVPYVGRSDAMLWDAMVEHARDGHRNCATRLPSLASGDESRRQVAWDILSVMSVSDPQCATTLPGLARTSEQKREAWDALNRFAATSADAASALSSLADTEHRRSVAWQFCDSHAASDSYCASTLAGLARTQHDLDRAFEQCVKHQGEPGTAVALMGLVGPDDPRRDVVWETAAQVMYVPSVVVRAASFADTPQRRQHVRQSAAALSFRSEEASAALAQLVDSEQDWQVAWDTNVKWAPTHVVCALALWSLSRTADNDGTVRQFLEVHAQRGEDRALSLLPKLAVDDADFEAMMSRLEPHIWSSSTVAMSYASMCEPGTRPGDAAWEACVRHLQNGVEECGTALPRLSSMDEHRHAKSLKLCFAVAEQCESVPVATSVLPYVHGAALDELGQLLTRFAWQSGTGAVGMYSAWKRGADISSDDVADALRRWAGHHPDAASLSASFVDTDSEWEQAWQHNVAHRFREPSCAFALKTLARTREEADVAAFALRHWKEDKAADDAVVDVGRYLQGSARPDGRR